MPLVFTVGSRLESVSSTEFMKNPTKITNALRQLRATLKLDGLCCYFDPSLEGVALEQAKFSAGSGDQVASKGRVPVAVEVLKRARVMLKDEPALIARITGPLTLARSQVVDPQHGAFDCRAVQSCAEALGGLAKAYVEAGADLILLVETVLPAPEPDMVDWWASLLVPIINVVRFYEAVPVLVLGDDLSAAGARLLAERHWECVLCPTVAGVKLLSPDAWKQGGAALGIALPTEVFTDAPSEVAGVQQMITDAKPVLLTTAGEISVSADLKHVSANLQRLRSALATPN